MPLDHQELLQLEAIRNRVAEFAKYNYICILLNSSDGYDSKIPLSQWKSNKQSMGNGEQ